MIRATTPTINYTVPAAILNAEELQVVFKDSAGNKVTIRNNRIKREINEEDKTKGKLTITLSQKETLRLVEGEIKMQIGVKETAEVDSRVYRSKLMITTLEEVLSEEIL